MTNGLTHEPTQREPRPMLTRARWEAECRFMARHFPAFEPFATEDGNIGFRGTLRGSRSARTYAVVLKARVSTYPAFTPAIYISPRPEPHHYCEPGPDGRLDVCWQWKPACSTFVQALLLVVKYLAEFDGEKKEGTIMAIDTSLLPEKSREEKADEKQEKQNDEVHNKPVGEPRKVKLPKTRWP